MSPLKAIRWQLRCLVGLCLLLPLPRGRADEGVKSANSSMRRAAMPEQPEFSRDIQPILSRACTSCHGGVKQAGDLSFVYADAFSPSEGWIVEPGKPEESILIERLTSFDPDLRMPPPHQHPEPLTADEIDLIRRWIAQGAHWQDHWSRRALTLPAVPQSAGSSAWAKQPLDHFIWGRLERAGLQPTDPADSDQWLRRASLDLVGLPPTPEELRAFRQRLESHLVAEGQGSSADAIYEAEVERLLASPHFGERWAALWMDLARYADSKGFEKDPHRDMWPYRDWLIAAFNADLPYDQFTIKQLAGDLLPEATYEDLVATAFHRNTQTNTEGGTDDEEYRMAAVIDRLNTTWTVWQATTFGCVQCHDHPYEPYQNVEFYQGLSLFNNTEDIDLDSDFPTLPYLERTEDRQKWVRLERQIEQLRLQLDDLARAAAEKLPWSLLPLSQLESSSGELGWVGDEVRVVGGTVSVGSTYTLSTDAEGEISQPITALRLQILPDSDDPTAWPEQGSVLSFLKLEVSRGEQQREISLGRVVPDFRAGTFACEDVLKDNTAGFGGYPKLFGPRWMVVTLEEPLQLASGETLVFSLKQSASVTGGLSNHLRRFRIESTHEASLNNWFASERFETLHAQLADLEKQYNALGKGSLPILVPRALAATRPTREFIRGNWLERGELVQPGIPSVFQPESEELAIPVTDRLELARWFVSEDNPLAARVWVNRIWAELFGVGIVETLEDFGVSGQSPSHPELLDYLAHTQQHEQQWHLKALLKSLVLSATYRQDHRVDAELRQADPRNRLLARGPRTRLTAEMVRDQALVAAGRLTEKLNGPSVMPPQPDGVWQQVYSGAEWKAATDEDRYRRGLYTYWKRTSPYPGFIMFDTPSRDVCSPRRIATNTPLQALVTLNSQVYTELAKDLADRCWEESLAAQDLHGAAGAVRQSVASEDEDSQADISRTTARVERAIRNMFYRVTNRSARLNDLHDLLGLWEYLEAERANEPVVERPPSPDRRQELEAREAALNPLGIVALAILNSDWAMTK
ncbi:PSD1 and planctomycete cytochrome C domain-containing protein [Aureliella helgolandensis]|nr:PSD1 and planctomycete cytochrome C domain-containing protein [Aureliella helgolandensis]